MTTNWKSTRFALITMAGTLLSPVAQAENLSQGYETIGLVADQSGQGRRADTNLVNPWGLVAEPGMLAVSDNHTGVSTFYRPGGEPVRLLVTIPAPRGDTNPAAPTGLVLNHSRQFVITNKFKARPSVLIYATEDGTISGWNPDVNRTNAIIKVDNSTNGAVYKGAAMAWTHDGPRLYVANFKGGTVEVYDGDFELVKSFKDTNAPAGFAPFGIREINGQLFVTLAKQKGPDKMDDEAGPGNGYVDVFDTQGNFVRALAAQGTLNSPWGLALAPKRFGKFSHALLVGNFGDGRINAFDIRTGHFLGQLDDAQGNPLVIEGLWGLTFSFGGEGQPFLYFTSGPGGESHGLFGAIRALSRHDDGDSDQDDD